MLGDSAVIPVPGKSALKPQGTISSVKQLRIDQKKSVSTIIIVLNVSNSRINLFIKLPDHYEEVFGADLLN